ncbi:MAG: DNA gyrase/topoisomerase IV subunit A, partial [Pedobacter sp.]
KLQFDLDFAETAIKGRASQGNILSKYPIKKIILKSKGVSTLSGLKIWYDALLRRLNVDGRGKYLGEFDGDDKILQVHKEGWYELSTFELSNHFDADLLIIQKYDPEKPFAVVQYEGKAKNQFVKRFVFEHIAVGKKQSFISEEAGSKLMYITGNPAAKLTVDVLKGKTQIPETLEILLAEFIDVKGLKANGNRLTQHELKNMEISDAEEEDLVINGGSAMETSVPVSVSEDVEPESAELTSEPDEEETAATHEDVVEEKVVETGAAPSVDIVEPAGEKTSDPTVEEEQIDKGSTPAPEATAAPAKKAWSSTTKPAKPAKKIDLEITNPDDIDIDDTGQLGLF